MDFFKKIICAAAVLLSVLRSSAQLPEAVLQLEDYVKTSKPDGYSPQLKYLTLEPKGNLHYLFPLYHAMRDEAKFKQTYTSAGFYQEVSQYFAFAGDYQSALQYRIKGYDSIDDASRRKIYKAVGKIENVTHVDARRYVNYVATAKRLIMINEAYDKPLHRAFMISLLADCYRHGYRYLAMEMLNNTSRGHTSGVNMHTGYYAAEPIAGELIRTAISIGYKLVPYEDTTAAVHTPNERDSIQAMNINEVFKKDKEAKVLVYAGYGNISKKMGDDGYKPMGWYLKEMSDIDPFTIDQTNMTEEGNYAAGRVWYQGYMQSNTVTTPSVSMINNQPVDVSGSALYDATIIHPPTKYQDGRPTWLNLGGLRQTVFVKPTVEGTFLVQAYYHDEISANQNKPWQLVPADQTYIPGGKKTYLLYLKKGKYTVIFRNMDYKILNTLNVEVN